MKKNGFTLAEVLITLGIIGVVAALTAPALVKNSGNAKIGPSLAKFVNTFETASEQLMADEGVSKLTSAISNSEDILNEDGTKSDSTTAPKLIIEKLSNYMIVTPLPTTTKYNIYLPSGVIASESDNRNGTWFQMKDGSIISVSDWAGTNNFNMGGRVAPRPPFKGVIAELIIDINGAGGNNQIGKEVFDFGIDDSGILIPYGGNLHKSLYTPLKGDKKGPYATFPYSCDMQATYDVDLFEKNNKETDSKGRNIYSGAVLDAYSCTGAIADNGWKVPN